MLPDYWLEQPPRRTNRPTREAIEEFLSLVDAEKADGVLDVDRLLAERDGVSSWQFLCGVADRRTLAFHGTGDPNIESFEPRKPIDFAPFGDQTAVFATSDPIWAMFYAIVDRERYPLTLNNACIIVTDAEGRHRRPHYYFSVSRDTLGRRPWRSGYLYFLPADTFVEQPPGTYAGHPARVPQLASPVAVRPFARMGIAPSDFPFLEQIRGHDDDRLAEYARGGHGRGSVAGLSPSGLLAHGLLHERGDPLFVRGGQLLSARTRSATWRRRRGSPGR